MNAEGNDITRHKGIYEKLQEDAEATALYQGFISHEPLLEDGTPIPKLVETIEADDDEGGTITVANPKSSPFRSMGTWAWPWLDNISLKS